MYPGELIGQKAVRTKPTTNDEGLSFLTSPILILAATEYHIVFERNKVKALLDYRYCDDNWTDYDELMKLADPEHQALMKAFLE